MDEPTLPEMIRELQRDVRGMRADQERYVTKEILDLRLEAVTKEQAELEERLITERARLDRMTQWFWSAILGPVIVGVILYFTLGKT